MSKSGRNCHLKENELGRANLKSSLEYPITYFPSHYALGSTANQGIQILSSSYAYSRGRGLTLVRYARSKNSKGPARKLLCMIYVYPKDNSSTMPVLMRDRLGACEGSKNHLPRQVPNVSCSPLNFGLFYHRDPRYSMSDINFPVPLAHPISEINRSHMPLSGAAVTHGSHTRHGHKIWPAPFGLTPGLLEQDWLNFDCVGKGKCIAHTSSGVQRTRARLERARV